MCCELFPASGPCRSLKTTLTTRSTSPRRQRTRPPSSLRLKCTRLLCPQWPCPDPCTSNRLPASQVRGPSLCLIVRFASSVAFLKKNKNYIFLFTHCFQKKLVESLNYNIFCVFPRRPPRFSVGTSYSELHPRDWQRLVRPGDIDVPILSNIHKLCIDTISWVA